MFEYDAFSDKWSPAIKDFCSLTPYWQGYAVYMMGCRDDCPYIPEKFTPRKQDKSEFDRGQHDAVIQVQDCP